MDLIEEIIKRNICRYKFKMQMTENRNDEIRMNYLLHMGTLGKYIETQENEYKKQRYIAP